MNTRRSSWLQGVGRTLLLIVLGCTIATLGLSIGYRSSLRPQENPAEFSTIGHDGWLEAKSALTFHSLAAFGNRLQLDFDPWRPDGIPAHVKVFVCGVQVGEFHVTADAHLYRVPLSGACEPRRVTFEIMNPTTVPNDARTLGVKLVSVSVGVWPGLPLPSVVRGVQVGLPLVLLLGVVLLGTRRLAPVFLAALAAGFLVPQIYQNASRLGDLFILTIALLIGLIFYSFKPLPPQPRVRIEMLLILLIMGIAAGLRFYGLDFGLPAAYHSDEPRKAAIVARMLAEGNLHPHYFLHPSLLLYLTTFFTAVGKTLGLIQGSIPDIHLAGRAVSATFGTLCVGLMWWIGRRTLGSLQGICAATLLATFPLHVTCSRYLKEDALFLFWLLAVVALVIESVVRTRPKLLLLAAVCAGLSFGSKYTGALAFLPILATPWVISKALLPHKRYFYAVLGSIPIFLLTFVCTTPALLVSFDEFLRDVYFEKKHMLVGHTVAVDAWSNLWMYHLGESIFPGCTLLATIAGLIGCVLLIKRWPQLWGVFFVGLILAFYLPSEWVKAKPAPQPERYILPCLPFLALAAGECIALLMARWRLVGVIVGIFILLSPAIRSAELASELRPDTRELMALWMRAHLPRDTKILINGEGYAPDFVDGFFAVRKLSRAEPHTFTLSALRASGAEYVLVSSLAYNRFFTTEVGASYFRDRFQQIFTTLPLVKEITPKFGTYGFHNPTLRLFRIRP
jgi:4-amino-4-deoxy-L-arabinose transferase-like glycosyltransferase